MTTLEKAQTSPFTRITLEEFLEIPASAEEKIEFVDGYAFNAAFPLRNHNRIVTALGNQLSAHLQDSECEVFTENFPVHIINKNDEALYGPDVVVTCDPTDTNDRYLERPTFIAEVFSESTRRIDLNEKRDRYLTLPSLTQYITLSQDTPQATVDLRTPNGWETHHLIGGATLEIPALKFSTPLNSLYQRVT